MRKTLHWLLVSVTVGYCCHPQLAHAEFSKERPIHHFFNARILSPGEHQISIVGNYKLGVSENLEIGTQALLLLLGGINLSCKHRMFERQHWETSFVFHGGNLRSAGQSLSSDGDENTDNKAISTSTTLLAAGLITTYDLSPTLFLNFGIYDYALHQKTDGSASDSTLQAHVISPSVGIDKYLGPNTAVTASITYPALLVGKLESDTAEVEINLALANLPPTLNPSVAFLTVTQSWQTFNLEGGLAFLATQANLYANAFWRFN